MKTISQNYNKERPTGLGRTPLCPCSPTLEGNKDTNGLQPTLRRSALPDDKHLHTRPQKNHKTRTRTQRHPDAQKTRSKRRIPNNHRPEKPTPRIHLADRCYIKNCPNPKYKYNLCQKHYLQLPEAK